MRAQQYIYFRELPLKAEFYLNGNKWIKQSTRTARLPEFNKWFYFGQKELCIVGVHSRLGEGY